MDNHHLGPAPDRELISSPSARPAGIPVRTIPDSSSPPGDAPRIHHRRLDPVFVVGHGRSGTSILTNLIRKYLHVGFGTESQFFIRYYRQLARYGDLSVEANRRLLIDDLSTERFFVRSRKYGVRLDQARAVADAEPTYGGVLAAILTQCAEAQQMTRWGDKTPEYSRHLPILRELFPTAQFIHVVRDGRDVALSGYEVHFGPKNAYAAAREWGELLERVGAFAATVPQGDFLEVRYEDLLRSPERTFERLIRFLDIDDEGGEVTRTVGRLAAAEIRPGNFDKWKTQFSRRDREIFEAMAGVWLERYGYQVEEPRPAPPGAIGRAYWSVDNVIRRAAMPAYWADNVYKAQLRLRGLLLPMRAWRSAAGTTTE